MQAFYAFVARQTQVPTDIGITAPCAPPRAGGCPILPAGWSVPLARSMSLMGHSLPIHSGPVPTLVRYCLIATDYCGAAK